jgi:hypothetical protein
MSSDHTRVAVMLQKVLNSFLRELHHTRCFFVRVLKSSQNSRGQKRQLLLDVVVCSKGGGHGVAPQDVVRRPQRTPALQRRRVERLLVLKRGPQHTVISRVSWARVAAFPASASPHAVGGAQEVGGGKSGVDCGSYRVVGTV